MTQSSLVQLYPLGGEQPQQAKGIYLRHRLHRQGKSGQPIVYSDYIVSLDGRISLASAHCDQRHVPHAITNDIDWRLYQELAAQADVLLTSGRYMRELDQGKAQAGLPVGDSFPDLHDWRREQGLETQPAVVILSRSLDLPLELLQGMERTVYIATGANADKRQLAAVAETGIPVLLAGDNMEVDGCRLIEELGEKGYRSIYSIAGPGLLDTLLRAGKVDRLYLTQVHSLLGGQCYDTLLESSVLKPAAQFRLEELYLDQSQPQRPGQLFATYLKA